MRRVLSDDQATKLNAFIAPKHPKSICIANYKGGVGKTTLVCLLGYFLAEATGKRVLMLDIDPQCTLSLAAGFDPEEVTRTELTIYNLVKPSKWARVKKTNTNSYVVAVPDAMSPGNLYIIRGSFEVDELDMEIAKSVARDGDRRIDELCLYCKQLLVGFEEYDYVLIDCPPNKMFLTQAMLRACSYYLPVTIPDSISTYGMPRLLRWVKQIPEGERPLFLGYVLNAVNRIGGPPAGMVYSQQEAANNMRLSIQAELRPIEKATLKKEPLVGAIPRLDAIARFLGERNKFSRNDFTRKTSGQPTIQECLEELTERILKRMDCYSAEA